MGLRDFPVSLESYECIETYFNELKKINTPEELKAHTNRWKAIWTLKFERKEEKITEEEQSVIDGTYDAVEALECVCQSFKPNNGCKHVDSGRSCAGMFIAMPVVVIFATMAANHYGVPVEVAMIQMCGGYGELYG